ncbi:hypothetical protein [Salinibaculum rarum]|uniref:hypothetical protein n=1 Tax=Salinibaculum rarum TaxID=3058903 RepID=UPI00265D86DF|nr:hypothetical protein [Salinibaculum sp. KK48]
MPDAERPSHSVASAERDKNESEWVVADHVKLAVTDGETCLREWIEAVELEAMPIRTGFPPLAGTRAYVESQALITFRFGNSRHGFICQVEHDEFVQVLSAAADEWGYEIYNVDADGDVVQSGAGVPQSIAAVDRDEDGAILIDAALPILAVRDGDQRQKDESSDIQLRVKPNTLPRREYQDKPGHIEFWFGTDAHGFNFKLQREEFERIMAAAANEWGYKITDANTEDDTDV